MWNVEWKIEKIAMELKTKVCELNVVSQKLILLFFCPVIFYSAFIRALLKLALTNFKRMLLVHHFDGFFCFLN